ncbi:GNAT family N-acetyltransferase [Chitinibacter fontanus]|uniref:GNAT family N-acetyltransferase n=1 Tax=Chitinibacter fontanus TaxID=1737446 RepID=A0A7D5V7S2_9NEIS|nr:GNAT family N-acetyltransferase [Chitinibacter fontanus]QLI80351.1 GNAT family N-acetyltransferase [Chitinibacter fontanus]
MALEIREILFSEYDRAAEVVWASFQHLAAQYQSPAGIEQFRLFAQASEIRARDAVGGKCYVAVIQNTVIGVLQVRADAHIALLFVLPEFQSRGVGRALIKKADADQRLLTVNASVNSMGAYMRYGFMPVGADQTSESGIRFVPMQRN